jgi:TolA-binding protein
MVGMWVLLFVAPAAMLRAAESKDSQIQALEERVRQLENRVKQLEKAAPAETGGTSTANRATLRERFVARGEQDRAAYTAEERGEIERLYQVANRQWRSPEAKESLKTLIEKFPKANRTGCALLYLGQMAEGAEREDYLKRAIADFGDCMYGNGVQVGAYARFHLGHQYLEAGKKTEATALFDEIRRDYPDAVDHKGRPLAPSIPK